MCVNGPLPPKMNSAGLKGCFCVASKECRSLQAMYVQARATLTVSSGEENLYVFLFSHEFYTASPDNHRHAKQRTNKVRRLGSGATNVAAHIRNCSEMGSTLAKMDGDWDGTCCPMITQHVFL